MTSAPKAVSDRKAFALAASVSLLAAAAHVWYVRADAAIPSWDDAWYLEESLRLFDSFSRGPVAAAETYVRLFHFKAPLLSVLAAPLFRLDRSAGAALGVNTAMVIALGVYVFLLARRLFGASAGVLSTFVVQTMPLLFGLSRQFMVDFTLAAFVSAWLFHLLASDGLRVRAHILVLGVLLGLGLLLKVLFPVFVALPTALHLYEHWRGANKSNRNGLYRRAEIVLAVGLPIALSWYAFNWIYVLAFAYSASVGAVASHYGGSRSLAATTGYLWSIATQGTSAYYALAGIIATALLAARRGFRRLRTDAWKSPQSQYVLAWVAPLALFLLGSNKEIRLIAPLLPAVAVGVAALVDRCASPFRWKPAALALFCVFPLDAYARATFGTSVLRHRPFDYAEPPRRPADWKQRELVRWIDDSASGADRHVVAVALEHRLFNANNLSYFAALDRRRVRFVNLGHAQGSVEAAILRVREKGASTIMTVTGVPESDLPEAFNRVNAEMKRRLDSGSLGFQKAGAFDLGEGKIVDLYERGKN